LGGFLSDLAPSEWMSETNSIIRNPPSGPNSRHHVGICDEARLQLWYGVETLSGPYPDCYHELADANPDGSLKTVLSAASNTSGECSGQSVLLTGRLNIGNFASYQQIATNNLASRTIHLYEDSVSIGTSTASGTAWPSNNWSSLVTHVTSAVRTYSYYVSFNSGEPALGSKTSSTFSVTWYPSATCPF
jgi:hypothetical protein